MKNRNTIIAEQSLEIIQCGSYEIKGRNMDVREKIAASVAQTQTITPEALDELILQPLSAPAQTTVFEVLNCTTMEAFMGSETKIKTAVLNFASAKNPGGGFIGGASAQEESLARSSSLYAALIKDSTMYNFNKGNSSYLYSDYMIYSPNVVFWMDDEGNYLDEPVTVDVITSPAPNKGAMLQNKRPEQIAELEAVFRRCIDKMLALALREGVECLILGAWGCGVFRNDTEEVAGYFREIFDTKYKDQFPKVVFAIAGRSPSSNTYSTFKTKFGQ
jgi:uncharacterized protein (TIGR02452 family)